MEFFAQLGALVEARFREHNFDEASFPEVALESLRELPPSEHLDYPALIRWALSAPRLPPQDLSSGFGEPPLTLYVGRRFYIEALFWLDGTTSIHQHAFSGAFHVLAGASLHSRYAFQPRERINSRLLVGDISLVDVTYLKQGDSLPIRSGRSGLVHSLFHLEQPSVTIVIRTPLEPDALPQYRLRRPSLAQASFTRDEKTTRQLQLLEVLRNLGHPDYLPLARGLLTEADFETAFVVLDHLNPHLEAAQLTELMALVHKRHGALARVLPPVLEEERRQAALIGRRRAVKQGDHRFFLALLLNLPHRQAILEQVRLRYGGDPIEWCVRCVEEMANLPATVPDEPNVLGFRMSEVGLLVLRGLIERRSFDEVKAWLLEEGYEAEDIQERENELRALYEGLRELYLFRTLFQDEHAAAR
jgi:hypothetical protein